MEIRKVVHIFAFLCGPFRQLNDALDASEVNLLYHPGFAIHPGDLPDIIVGSYNIN